jgi:DnaJ-class molecular chaperone
MDFKDYYQTLEVARTASDADIKRAYRKLARQSHPDLHPDDVAAEARFKEINEAYEVLGDPETRRKYDELGANWKQYEQAAAGGAGRTPDGWSVHVGGQPGGGAYRTMSAEEMESLFGTDDPFSDFFHTFFGGAPSARPSRRRKPRPRRGRDLVHSVELTLEEAFAGTTRRVTVSRSGHKRAVEVRIPAGVRDGMRVRAAGEGGRASHGGAPGDLFLAVTVGPHARFERTGEDLRLRVPIPVTTAVLGGQVEVSTLADTTLRLSIPPHTNTGRVFRLRGHGMPIAGTRGTRGDLFATVDVQVPATLSVEARRHYEALRALEEGPDEGAAKEQKEGNAR